ncbi:cytochrome c biogenesis protein CcdA [Alkalibaculum sp. M08DMB]|uniref:Cytochrome c biogenesis protein CcdA n=1 Tax=Alkalibaculum sporogenes TaxID=2655001 RepID=A0A6A7K537_9FIRM|nr:cytochrome c biogenesis protein CcdA [Alkalibaculum sporogenes]MPW24444.1 cytochrome c biogenesis protein CcdA [Alkalibaculum sporogenes]
MINQFLETLAIFISESLWFAPFFALLAGILTSVMPCSLSSVPLVIGYVGGTSNNDPKKAFRLSVTFALGMAVTFTILGTVATVLGNLMGTSNKLWYIGLGILMVLMALQIWDVYQFIPSTYLTSKSTKRGYIGAILAGMLGGVFSSPCSTPVLIVLLGIVTTSGNIIWSMLLLLLYSIGHSVIVIFAGTSIGLVNNIISNEKYGVFSKYLKYVMGGIILFIAFYMFYLGF